VRYLIRCLFSAACGTAAGFAAVAFGAQGMVPFYIGFVVMCVVQLVQG
jgi:hypothetical protein